MAVATAPAADARPLALPGPAGDGAPTEPSRRTVVLGVLLFVAAEAMVLGAMVAIYFAVKSGAPRWPPRGVRLGIYLPLTVAITALMSAASARWALFAVRRNDQRNAVIALALTTLFAIAMVNAEWYALGRRGLGVGRHAYGSLYATLIGFHIFHVLLSIPVLLVVAGRTLAGHFRMDDHEPVRAASILWQFGNVVWMIVAVVLYVASKYK